MSVENIEKHKTWKICLRIVTGCLLVAWMVVIFCFSAQPATESSELSGSLAYRIVSKADEVFDGGKTDEELLREAEVLEKPLRKAAHMTEYAILAILAAAFFMQMWPLRPERRRHGRALTWHYLAALILAFCYASTDEFHQLFVEGRSSQFTDVLIDTAGAAVGLLVLLAVLRICRGALRRCQARTPL